MEEQQQFSRDDVLAMISKYLRGIFEKSAELAELEPRAKRLHSETASDLIKARGLADLLNLSDADFAALVELERRNFHTQPVPPNETPDADRGHKLVPMNIGPIEPDA